MAQVKAAMSPEELEAVKETFRKLNEFQESEDAKEDLEKIPLLKREDMKKEANLPVNEVRSIGDTILLYHDLFTNGIGYLRLIFRLDQIPGKYFPYIGILKGCLGLLNTENYTYGDLYNEMNLVTGGMAAVNNVYGRLQDTDEFTLTLELKTKVFYDRIADAIDLAVVVLRGLADFLSAVFRGNWDAAWQAIGNTVNTVWDKMTNAIKTAVNGIIGFINRMISAVVTGINAVINALNGLSFDLPDIFGGGHVGFNISTLTAPQIPYLAQGAVIPANREFLAVLGDQSHGTNVEAPLDTIKQAVAEVMEDLQAGQMAGFEAVVSVLREILSAVYGIELTDEDVGRAVQRWQRKQLTATGGV